MRILFYIVHPSKYHLFRNVINKLLNDNKVDIIINSKDVLEELIKKEKWKYKNIFKKGRNIYDKPSTIRSFVNFIITILKLEYFIIKNKRYDIFITDDALVVNGYLHGIYTLYFNDNDVISARNDSILMYFATNIISPHSTDLGKYEFKKIPFKGNKALAHLHINYFTPSIQILKKYKLIPERYCVVRVSKLNASHDINGNYGITDYDLAKFYKIINYRIKVIIIAERNISEEFSKDIYKGDPSEIFSIMFYAKFVISDSGTMATEAAVLGTPNILINKLAKNIGVHNELKNAGLQYYFDKFEDSLLTIEKILENKVLKEKWIENRTNYLKDCDDLNKLLLSTITKKIGKFN